MGQVAASSGNLQPACKEHPSRNAESPDPEHYKEATAANNGNNQNSLIQSLLCGPIDTQKVREHLECSQETHITQKSIEEAFTNNSLAKTTVETDIHTVSEAYVELCPVGEQVEESVHWSYTSPSPNNVFVAEAESSQPQDSGTADSPEWKARRKLFTDGSSRSIDSDVSSMNGSVSLNSYLKSREFDASELLLDLGFGQTETSFSVPLRFLQAPSVLSIDKPSQATSDDDDDDNCPGSASASLLSYPSTWSDRASLYDRIPARFSSSRSESLSDLTDSEQELDKTTPGIIPVIVGPEVADDSFDLMRHLRLNRNQQRTLKDGIYLEPLTEELEVSSVGSASERTKTPAKQESVESLGTASVLTKISRKQDSVDTVCEKHETKHVGPGSTQGARENADASVDSTNCQIKLDFNGVDDARPFEVVKSTPLSLSSESGIGSSLVDQEGIPVSGGRPGAVSLHTGMSRTLQESFELEEIATEENCDCMDRKGDKVEARSRQIRRGDSGESSGFEDEDIQDRSKQPDLVIPQIRVDLHEPLPQTDIESQCSRKNVDSHTLTQSSKDDYSCSRNDPITDRRSSFAKRRSWSGSRQTAYEDDILRPKSHTIAEVNTEKIISLSSQVMRSSRDQTEQPSLYPSPDLTSDPKNRTASEISDKPAAANIKSFFARLMPKKAFLNRRNHEDNACGTRPSDKDRKLVADISGTIEKTSSKGESRDRLRLSLDELDATEERLCKYYTTFNAMESVSTIQRNYYTKKLLARLAWDVSIVRQLRELIVEQISEIQSQLRARRQLLIENLTQQMLPSGVVSQLTRLLAKQTALRDQLMKLSKDVRDSWSGHESNKRKATLERQELVTKIKRSIVAELAEQFSSQFDELRQELRAKDAIISELQEMVTCIQARTR
ncbi:uncharacterized protein LOC116604286 isoform X2 [Nematostella vectensis]|uniref:uncharacterized protein LOC116604286 isoform X2 n=1 Tax=Nematostella vectensis TaxID=45351 RepID=UPI002076EA5C|nr:uncharacterized protein LOC116604286 isoform X2 [Nematostella vectensis]XP_048579975.1 uncharacterized protein LOC116604286 isoform X2 [Nematostella vectensis]